MGAYIVQHDDRPHVAIITFHTVISTPDAQGRLCDRCNRAVPLPVPAPAEFEVVRLGALGIMPLTRASPFSYTIKWRNTHRFIIRGIPWEDFVQQISVARCALASPEYRHNIQRL
jgi:hypothetical protein